MRADRVQQAPVSERRADSTATVHQGVGQAWGALGRRPGPQKQPGVVPGVVLPEWQPERESSSGSLRTPSPLFSGGFLDLLIPTQG